MERFCEHCNELSAYCEALYIPVNDIHPAVYRVSQEECARLRKSVPYVKVYRFNPKHLYPKLNGYGDNGQRILRSSCGSTYCTCSADALRVYQNAQPAKLNQYSILLDIHVPYKVLGNLRTTTDLMRVFM